LNPQKDQKKRKKHKKDRKNTFSHAKRAAGAKIYKKIHGQLKNL
jgi:hypothetical protein